MGKNSISIFLIAITITSLVVAVTKNLEVKSLETRLQYISQIPTLIPTSSPQQSANSLSRRNLVTKKYSNTTFTAYRISQSNYQDSLEEIYVIQDDNSKSSPEIVGTAANFFTETNVFDITDNKLLLISSAEKALKIYQLDDYNYVQYQFKETIPLPESLPGTLYGIQCNATQCEISTAKHQEAGCSAQFNIVTNKFTDIICPEPYSYLREEL